MHNMLKKLSGKLRAKFPATTPGYSMVKIAHLNDAFLKVFQLEASPVEGQSLQQKEKKRRKRKVEKKNRKPKDIGHFLVQILVNFLIKILISAHPSQNVLKTRR